MDCWARINGKDYPIAYGWTLTEEFSESLDTASIILPHVREVLSIKPYDDVIIHDFDPATNPLPPRPFGVQINTKEMEAFKGHFYRHMVVNTFNREQLSMELIQTHEEELAYAEAQARYAEIEADKSLSDDEKLPLLEEQAAIMADNSPKYAYNYTIELWSETKGLESVQLPNKTISQPMDTTELGTNQEFYESPSFLGYSSPLNVVNRYNEGCMFFEYRADIMTWIRCFLIAGDWDEATADFSIFSKMPRMVQSDTEFRLPDWNISAVTVVQSQTVFWAWNVGGVQQYTPKKIWVIREMGNNDSQWVDRDDIINNIKAYVGGTNFPEIVNQQVCGMRNVETTDSVASFVGKFPLLGENETKRYAIYLYVEPQYYTPLGQQDLTINVFGMVNVASGQTAPKGNDEFLAVWYTNCSNEIQYTAHSVLTVAEAVRQAIELYSPYVKITKDGKTWQYVRKYSLSESTKNEFAKVVAPENQWNFPNLRDFITRLFYVADCIPVVHDGVISHMRLSQRSPKPFEVKEGCLSYEHYSMDGSSYCDRLLRVYSDGLSKDNVTNCVERVGFKNANSALLTLDSLQIELSYPIYRINKVYMCYYNKYRNSQGTEYMRLCKQDITPLILLNAQRNLLSEDWNSLNNVRNSPSSIEDLAKFKYATIGYDIGSKTISGWGMKYSTPMALFWSSTRTVIENIWEFVRKRNPYGLFSFDEDMSGYEQSESDIFGSNADENREALTYENDDYAMYDIESNSLVQNSIFGAFFGNYTQRIKSLMFIIDYQGYISASVIASKDFHDGNVVSRDNASSSLSFVESDGINQKEKANRLGNATMVVSGRYVDFSDIQELSQVWTDDVPEGQEKAHDDDVLFKRTISFNKDYFPVTYYFCRNYVLRNYFTSVFSKHRPFPLASYEESVERIENKTLEMLISPDESYWQDSSKRLLLAKDNATIGRLVSFYTSSKYDNRGNIIEENGVDSCYYCVYPSKSFSFRGQTGIFATDNQKFVSGNSLCFVVSMKDNVSAGVYSSNLNHNVGAYVGETIQSTWDLVFNIANGFYSALPSMVTASNLLTGSKQDWYMFPVDPETGMLYSMSFGVGFKNDGNDAYAVNSIKQYNLHDIASAQLLPLMDVVLERSDEKVYFGGEIDDNGTKRVVGCGYPQLRFYKSSSNEGKYFVDFSTKNEYYTYQECVQTIPTDEDFLFAECPRSESDAVIPLNPRNSVKEFVSALFVGHETDDTAEETDTCVFKDGKERISATMQIEPICNDSRVAISPYFMGLSDAMGGKEKNYSENYIESNILFMFGVSQIRVSSSAYQSADGKVIYATVSEIFATPTLSICLPKGLEVTSPIEVNKEWRAEGDAQYSIFVKRIIGINTQSVEGVVRKVLIADCTISCSLYSGDQFVTFYKKSDSDYVLGRTASSKFASSVVCFDAGMNYDSYVFCEDAFFVNASGNVSINMQNKESGYNIINGAIGTSSLQGSLLVIKEGKDLIDFSDNTSAYTSNYNFSKYSLLYKIVLSTGKIIETYADSLDAYNNFILEEGPSASDSTTLVKAKTMYWCESTDKLNKESSYDVLDNEPDHALAIAPNDVSVGIEDGITMLKVKAQPSAKGSVRLYYYEKQKYHFVFGFNASPALQQGEQRDSNYVYPNAQGEYVFYLSFLDDRSKTVINDISGDAHQGDPLFKVSNYLNQSEIPTDIVLPTNICIEK